MTEQSTMKQVRDLCREAGVGAVVDTPTICARAAWLHRGRVSGALSNLARKCSDLELLSKEGKIRQYRVTEDILVERAWTRAYTWRLMGSRKSEHLPNLDPRYRQRAEDLLFEAIEAVEKDNPERVLELTREAYYLVRDNRRKT